MNTCTFCRIISGELNASRIWHDGIVVAFLDIEPINPGHTLILPRRHVTSFTELASIEVEGLMKVAQRVALALKSTLNECEGVTVSIADGDAAGQEVPHAHFHVIPRHSGDGFGWRRFGKEMDRSELDQIALKIQTLIETANERNV